MVAPLTQSELTNWTRLEITFLPIYILLTSFLKKRFLHTFNFPINPLPFPFFLFPWSVSLLLLPKWFPTATDFLIVVFLLEWWKSCSSKVFSEQNPECLFDKCAKCHTQGKSIHEYSRKSCQQSNSYTWSLPVLDWESRAGKYCIFPLSFTCFTWLIECFMASQNSRFFMDLYTVGKPEAWTGRVCKNLEDADVWRNVGMANYLTLMHFSTWSTGLTHILIK